MQKGQMDKTEKVHELSDLDLTAASRGVWLVKVPKYLAERWKKAGSSNEVGKLRITQPRFQGGKPEVLFSLQESLAKKDETGEEVPRDHKFVVTGTANQKLFVLTQDGAGVSGDTNEQRVAVEGKVMHRAECRPLGDDNYMKLKRIHVEQQNKPQRQVQQLDKIVLNYKPKSDHQFNKDYLAKKKDEGKKSRKDKEQVMDMLFSAFEKHQYYNVRDLVNLTRQPAPYLKEILKEICVYNMKAPHKNMWELKPEYRHYKESSGSGTNT
ncbi:general transcription factor IIF subunit 2 [Lingula anatina]|uniref:General transcription factor IIF subunit 2 n=1 Tax=Lingula anatina TaxID=7574 RepID=A0A1S3IUS3_LINAN|nr:general transcription factor IIF subunit 2 [Lingula anatina]|eukprot:XP_013401289.1 general transcription factor IIF subunit 2 [Lingula anatina]